MAKPLTKKQLQELARILVVDARSAIASSGKHIKPFVLPVTRDIDPRN